MFLFSFLHLLATPLLVPEVFRHNCFRKLWPDSAVLWRELRGKAVDGPRKGGGQPDASRGLKETPQAEDFSPQLWLQAQTLLSFFAALGPGWGLGWPRLQASAVPPQTLSLQSFCNPLLLAQGRMGPGLWLCPGCLLR